MSDERPVPPEPTGRPAATDARPGSDNRPGGGNRPGLESARRALASAKADARRRGTPAGSGQPGRRTSEQAPARRTRGQGETRSGAGPDDRDPQTLAASLDRLLAERGWETDAAVGGALGRWGAIVGPDVAAHSSPVSCADGELVVVASSTAWATQLRLLAPVLVRRLAEELGPGTVSRITVRGPAGPSWRRGALRVPGRGPRDTYG